MPHSKLKERAILFNSGVGKCPYGQTIIYESDRDLSMKVQLHRKVCPNLPEGHKHIRTPKKAMTLKEVQHNDAEGRRRVHNNHQ